MYMAIYTFQLVEWDIALKDGRIVTLRRPTIDDARAIADFFRQRSPENAYRRLFDAEQIEGDTIGRLLAADGMNECVSIAQLETRVVAIARYARWVDPSADADAHVVVADSVQGRGIGTYMLSQLAEHGRRNGILRFHTSVVASNDKMMHALGDSGFEVAHTTADGAIELLLTAAEPLTEGVFEALR
jgi:GNAT superfamily N-acetyltransferase